MSDRPRVLTVVGARPQFIKAFAVSRALSGRCEEVLVHTGQHYDEELSDVFFDELGLEEPAYQLGVGSASHAAQTGEMLARLGEVVETERPDTVLVYGDTNSTLAGALAAAKHEHAPAVAHVEAGLRSFDRSMPEETNRVLVDHAADTLFAPTDEARENLAAEGITDGVHVTGDVMIDTLHWGRERAVEQSSVLADLDLTPGEFVLATVHRAGNTDDPDRLAAVFDGLAAADLPVVLPLHPRTEARLSEYGLSARATEAVQVVDPLPYLDFVRLLDTAARVATDSGGVQKEAYALGTPCVTMRPETEWVETVEAGWNTLVDADAEAIAAALAAPAPTDDRPPVYGDGTAAGAIAAVLLGGAGADG
jgi:UDP-N-acetylglucosamine 2-epimerase (non-hydrolysing)